MADVQQVPWMNDSVGPQSLAIVCPLFAFAIVVFSARIYTRVIPTYKLNACDYTNVVAVVAEVITFSLFVAAISNGFGRHNYFLSPESIVTIQKLLFGVQFVGLWASIFARISFALFLLQFALLTLWKIILWAIIGLEVAALLASEIFQLLECRPIRANWMEVADAQCVNSQSSWDIGWLFVAISILCDLIVIVIPMFLLWSLSRHVLEKCLIFCLMGLGLFATTSGILKLVHLTAYDSASPDTFREMITIYLWCRIEECVLITASSAPLLKAPIEQILDRCGFPIFRNAPKELDWFHSERTSKACWWRSFLVRQKDVTTSGPEGLITPSVGLEPLPHNHSDGITTPPHSRGGYTGSHANSIGSRTSPSRSSARSPERGV